MSDPKKLIKQVDALLEKKRVLLLKTKPDVKIKVWAQINTLLDQRVKLMKKRDEEKLKKHVKKSTRSN